MFRILLAYNDSPGARQALAEALLLAHEENAELIVLAVEDGLSRYDAATVSEVRYEHERKQRDCRRWLRTAEAHASESGVPVHTELRIGNLPRQLASAATAHQANLVIVGHTTHRSIWGRLGRTKPEKVSRWVSCPVRIIPPPSDPGT